MAVVGIMGCFSPNENLNSSSVGTTEPSDSTGAAHVTTSGGTTTGTSGETSLPTLGPTTEVTTDDARTSSSTGLTTATDGTTSQPECDDVDAPCPEDQYCVDGTCEDPPDGMVAVPAGTFWMGCNEDIDAECEANEFPYHEVFLSAFAIGRTEVTAEAYIQCVDEGGCSPMQCGSPAGQLPATCVDWSQASGYCEWAGGRLPTEAEWEKAARGTDGRLYPWGNQPPTCNLVNMSGCGGLVGEVGSRPAGASPYGALDMAGNVQEWIGDWYDASYYLESPAMDPPGPDSGTQRWPRNGAYFYLDGSHRCSHRGDTSSVPTPEDYELAVGFRCVFNP